MEQAFCDELADAAARREEGVEADPGVRPLLAVGHALVDVGADASVPWFDETRCELLVFIDDRVADAEDVHGWLPPLAAVKGSDWGVAARCLGVDLETRPREK